MLEDIDGVEVDSETLIDGVVSGPCLSIIDDLLHIIQDEGTEQEQTSIQPDVHHCWRGIEHVHQAQSYEGTTSHSQGSSPLQELLTGSVVGNCS